MMKKPVSALNNRRPVTQYAKMAAAMGGNPRYKVRSVILRCVTNKSFPFCLAWCDWANLIQWLMNIADVYGDK